MIPFEVTLNVVLQANAAPVASPSLPLVRMTLRLILRVGERQA